MKTKPECDQSQNKILTYPERNNEMDYENVKDSGSRAEFETGAVRDIQEGKGRFDLIPADSLQRLAQHYENGAKKYGDRNWEKGQPLYTYLNSANRHITKLTDGQFDEDHASAIVWNIFSFIHIWNQIVQGKLPWSLTEKLSASLMRQLEQEADKFTGEIVLSDKDRDVRPSAETLIKLLPFPDAVVKGVEDFVEDRRVIDILNEGIKDFEAYIADNLPQGYEVEFETKLSKGGDDE